MCEGFVVVFPRPVKCMKVIYICLDSSLIICSHAENRYCITLPFSNRIPVILIIKQNLLGISRNLSLRMAFQECLACESDTCNSGGF